MIIQEINKYVELKLDILELKQQLKREKKANNFKKVLKLKILITKRNCYITNKKFQGLRLFIEKSRFFSG